MLTIVLKVFPESTEQVDFEPLLSRLCDRDVVGVYKRHEVGHSKH